MRQPELGKKLAEIRQLKNLTQEELVDACHVSVRTIQRIEAGEVTPRTSTIKILLSALDVDFEDFQKETSGQPQNDQQSKRWLQVAWIGGLVYLLLSPFEMLAEMTRASSESFLHGYHDFGWFDLQNETIYYITIKVLILISFSLMMMGFVRLAETFQNYFLKIGAFLMIGVVILITVADSVTLLLDIDEAVAMGLGVVEAMIAGSVSIAFGIGLLRLQDGMGKLALAAGILEIIIGCCLLVVVLFFLGYLLMLPANIIEIVLLYKGYEFLSKESQTERRWVV